MAKKPIILNEQLNNDSYSNGQDILDTGELTSLLEETNTMLTTHGVNLEDPDSMINVFKDETTTGLYIDSLAEGLNPEDTKVFKHLCNNMIDEINGRGSFSGKATMRLLAEDNISAGFMPKAKVLFPMFRFTWPRLHIREICTVLPIDSPETVRYFFKAVAKNLDGGIIPLPSYSPIGNGQAIGTMSNPAEIPLPGTVDLLSKIGATSANTHIEKDCMIIGWEGIDSEGNDVSDVDDNIPILYTLDADGKMELHINVNPKGDYQLLDVVTGFMDYQNGVFSVSSSRQAESNGKVTKIKLKANATTSEHNIAPKISFDSKQVKFQVKDIQLQAEWTQQYVTDMNKRTGMDVLSELVVIMGNQTQLTINRMILDDIIMHVGRHGDNIRKFIAEPSKARNSFAYTKKQWADELLYHIEVRHLAA